MKHWTPRIADAAEAALATGADTVAGSCSRRTTRGSRSPATGDQLEEALARPRRARLRRQLAPGARLRRPARRPGARARRRTSSSPRTRLPARILARGRPVRAAADGDRDSYRAGAQALRDWSFSYQSASPTGEPWLGPDILDHLDDLHARGVDAVLICPVGFVADHLEIRWDLDTQAQEKARRAGHAPRPDRDAERRSGVRRHAGDHRAAGARGTLDPHETGRDPRRPREPPLPRRPGAGADAEGARAARAAAAEAAEVWALRDVSLEVEPGDAVGLVGRNGSGKTTLLSLIAGIITPTSGRVEAGGRVASLLELGAGFHPDFSGRENVYLNGSLYGLKRRTIDERFDEIVAFAELERFIDNPVRTYSSGMYMRLGFAVAAHIDADVLLLDEVFAVGDEEFQRKCFGKIFEYKQRGGTIVFVSARRRLRRAALPAGGAAAKRARRARRLGAGSDRPLPQAARRRARPGRGRGRPARVRQRRGAHRRGARCSAPTGEERLQLAAGEPLVVELRIVAREALAPPRRLARAPRRGGPAARRRGAGHRRARLGRGARRARAPVRGRASAARRRTVPPALRARRPAPAAASTTGWTTRSGSSSTRARTRAARCCSRARWSLQETGAAAELTGR